jgi:hypothetical protein
MIALNAAYGGVVVLRWLQAERWTRGIVVLLWCFGVVSLQPLSNPTEVDTMQQVLAEYGQPTDIFLLGCCVDVPLYYLQPQLFLRTEATQRLILIPTPTDPLAILMKNYALTAEFVARCVPEVWGATTVYVCPLE